MLTKILKSSKWNSTKSLPKNNKVVAKKDEEKKRWYLMGFHWLVCERFLSAKRLINKTDFFFVWLGFVEFFAVKEAVKFCENIFQPHGTPKSHLSPGQKTLLRKSFIFRSKWRHLSKNLPTAFCNLLFQTQKSKRRLNGSLKGSEGKTVFLPRLGHTNTKKYSTYSKIRKSTQKY